MENKLKSLPSQLRDSSKISMNNRAAWLCCFFFLSSAVLWSQNTFNKNYYRMAQTAYHTCNVTSSGYLLTGWCYDTTTTPVHWDLVSHVLDEQGNLVIDQSFGSFDSTYIAIGNCKSFKDNEYIQVAFGYWSDTNRLQLHWLNANGDLFMSKSYLSPNIGLTTAQWDDYVFPQSAFLTATGEVYVCSEIGTADTGNDIFVMKTDAEGNELWRYTYSPVGEDRALSLLPIVNDVILGALTDWDNEGIEQCLFLKLDENGDSMWSLDNWNSTQFFAPLALHFDGDDIVATSGFREVDSGCSYCSKAVILKIDTLGNTIWQTPYSFYEEGGPKNLNTLIQTPDSNFVAAGSWWEYSGMLNELGEDIPEYFTYLIKVDRENGDIIWERYYNLAPLQDGVTHEIYDMKPTPDGGLIFCGEVVADFGPNEPYQQGWIVKLDACGCLVPGCDENCVVGQQELQIPNSKFKIGPNPARDYINIYLNKISNVQHSSLNIQVHNLAGNIVKSFSPHRGDTTYIVDTAGLAAGQYVVSLVSEGVVLQSEKIMVAR